MRISVVCPVYNTPPNLLRAATQSVIDVAGSHLHELILVDDVSTDVETIEAVKQIALGDRRIVVVRSPRNVGQSSARNLGIHTATGDWIGFLDHDDLWLPGRTELAVAVIEEFPDAKWIAGNFAKLYGDGSRESALTISAVRPGSRLSDCLVRFEKPDLTRRLLRNGWFHLGASLIWKELLESIGGFYDGFYFQEDYIFFARISVVADLFFIEQDFYLWRRDIDSLWTSPARLTEVYAAGWRRTRDDALLRPFRRDLRWTLYGTYKGLALNNLLNGFRGRGFYFAFRALMLDPRELGEFLLFLRLMMRRDNRKLPEAESRYSSAERFIVRPR
jgi:glycosyltransferase involved in cell wall biosynthesis